MMKLAIPGDEKVQRIVKKLRMGYHLAEPIALFRSRALQLYYQRYARDGHFVIMDNGAAEVSIMEDGKAKHIKDAPLFPQVVNMAKKIGCDEIVLPDRKQDMEWTVKNTIEGAGLVSPIMRAVCPQGRNADEWITCFEMLQDAIEFRTVCIAKIYDRLKILDWMEHQDIPEHYHVHLLGLGGAVAGSDIEFEIIQTVKRFPWVRGVDSAVAIAFAQHDVNIEDYRVSFSYQWGGKFNAVRAVDNILKIQEWIRECTY